MLAGVGQNVDEALIQPLNGDRIITICFPPYYNITTYFDKYDPVSPFMDAALNPRNHSAYVFVSAEEELYLRSMVWKTASVTQLLRSCMS